MKYSHTLESMLVYKLILLSVFVSIYLTNQSLQALSIIVDSDTCLFPPCVFRKKNSVFINLILILIVNFAWRGIRYAGTAEL